MALLPIPNVELGASGAWGDAAVVEHDGAEISGDPARKYEVLGADFAHQAKLVDVRGEYIQQDVDDEIGSVAPDGGKWKVWYVQGAYKLGKARWEIVARYTDFDSPHPDDDQKQWAPPSFS